jgi:S-DNA-T family DNA segregation ATPase FtsK/SpoIIIE
VTGLAVTHPPDLLSLVLVDFKGGPTFAGMAELPHVAGIITNMQLLRRAGNLDSVRQYQERRSRTPARGL